MSNRKIEGFKPAQLKIDDSASRNSSLIYNYENSPSDDGINSRTRNEKTSRILGIDPGLNNTGWAIIERIPRGIYGGNYADNRVAAASGGHIKKHEDTTSERNALAPSANNSTITQMASIRSLNRKSCEIAQNSSNFVSIPQFKAANKQFRYIASGIIRSKLNFSEDNDWDKNDKEIKEHMFYKKIMAIFLEISQIIEKFHPNHCAIEDTYVNSNFGSSLKLAHARTAAIIAVLKSGSLIPIAYPAKTIKKTLTNNGNADKNAISQVLSLFLEDFQGTNCKLHDESDSLAIALCHGYHLD